MAKKKFRLKSKASSEAVRAATANKGGKNFKFKKTKTRLLILPPVEEDASVFVTTYEHTFWSGGKPAASCSSPFATGDEDKIQKLGWRVRDRFKESKDSKLKDFYRNLLVTERHAINVLDIDDIDAGSQKFIMPISVSDVVLEELKDVDDDDLTDICDLDEGRILSITTNGEHGTKKVKYKSVKFDKKTANLKEDGLLDDDSEAELIENMPDLTKIQKKWNEEEFEDFLKKVMKAGEKIGIDWEDLDSEDDDDDDEDESSDDDGFEDDDISDDDEDESSDDDDDDDEVDVDELKDDLKKLKKKYKKESDKKNKKKLKKKIEELMEEIEENS